MRWNFDSFRILYVVRFWKMSVLTPVNRVDKHYVTLKHSTKFMVLAYFRGTL